MISPDLRSRTIRDFSDQWLRYTDNEGFYGSVELLADMVMPLISTDEFKGKRITEIGSGTGRIVRMLLDAGAEYVTAIEPSAAVEPLRQNLAEFAERVSVIQAGGENFPVRGDQDFLLSIGVLHHIPEPGPVVARALEALRPGGRIIVWLYGKEGNELYLTFVQPLRRLTSHLPHHLLAAVCHLLNVFLFVYIGLCRVLPLPLAGYMRNILGRFDNRKRFLVIYDQLNPAYAKYYRREEAEALIRDAGFVNVQSHARHGYSWTVVGARSQKDFSGEISKC